MLISILLLIFCICCVVLKKAYHHLDVSPVESLDSLYKYIRVVSKHLTFISLFLDFLLLAGLSLLAISIAFTFELFWSFLILIVILLTIFIIIPNLKTGGLSLKLAFIMGKPLAYFLHKINGPITRLEKSINKANKRLHYVEPLTKDSLIKTLKEQSDLAESTIKTDLRLAISALGLNDKKVGYLMVRKHKAKLVGHEDLVGPILLSELHDTGRKLFAVENDDEIIGTIKLADLTELKSGGKVKKVMNRQVVKIDKEAVLLDAVSKFIEHGSELLVVQDEAKTIGVIYLEDVFRNLVLEPAT